MEDDNVRAFYQELQKLRIKKSGAIDTLFTFFLTSLVLILSFLGKAYVDKNDVIYIFIAFIISAFLIGFWRYRTHAYDKAIQRLYPDLVFCEMILEIPEELGLKNFLINNDETDDDKKNKYKEISNDPNLGKEEKARKVAKIIAEMVEEEKVPNRGHDETDFFALVLLLLLFGLTILGILFGTNMEVCTWNIIKMDIIMCGIAFFVAISSCVFIKWNKIKKFLDSRVKNSSGDGSLI